MPPPNTVWASMGSSPPAAPRRILFLVSASPLAGRLSDRRGRALPLRLGLAGVGVACLAPPLPTAVWTATIIALLAVAAGGLLTAPAMALLSDTAEATGLAQGLAFGLVNLAWAGGQGAGALGGAGLADATSDAAVYLLMAGVVAATLAWLTARAVGSPSPPTAW